VDIRQIRYFLKIAEKGSFTKAAEHLGVAQPALGLQIRKLEEELQVELLVRHSKGVDLTEAGRLLAYFGDKIMDDFSAARRAIASIAELPGGRIVVGVTPTLADRIVIPLLERVDEVGPDIAIHVVEGLSAVLAEKVHDGSVDFAVGYDMSSGPDLSVRRLGFDQVCLIEASATAAGKPETAEFSEISGKPLILPPRPHRVRQLVEDAARERKVSLNVVHEVYSAATSLRMVERGMGCALSGVAVFERHMRDRKVVARPLVNPSPTFEFGLVHLDRRPLSSADLRLARLIENLLSEAIADG
jgi:LysR family nitrogen assimilation transcriptional regulator